jgi:hypothetical protein
MKSRRSRENTLKNLYLNKLKKTEEMDKFLDMFDLSKLRGYKPPK